MSNAYSGLKSRNSDQRKSTVLGSGQGSEISLQGVALGLGVAGVAAGFAIALRISISESPSCSGLPSSDPPIRPTSSIIIFRSVGFEVFPNYLNLPALVGFAILKFATLASKFGQ